MNIRNKINGFREIWQFDNRWQLALNRILFPGEKLNIYRYRGLEFITDHSAGDANGAREVLTSGMYRQFLAEIMPDGPASILDIGANNGGFPLLLSSEGIFIRKLVSIELNPKTHKRLQFNLERNFGHRFIALNAALCGENREIELALGDGSTSDSIFDGKNGQGERIKVEGISFDEIYRRFFKDEEIDICKMDIEGAEFEVFGSENFSMIVKCRFILIEIHQDERHRREEVLGALAGKGFEEIKRETGGRNGEHLVHLFRKRN